MSRKNIAFGVGAGMVSLGVDGLTGLLILRLLLRYLPADIAGFWILVTSAGAFLMLLQCGLGPTVARAVARARATDNNATLCSLLGAVEQCFRYIAIGVIVLASVIFGLYLWPTAKSAHVPLSSALSWFLYTFGLIANLQGQASLFILNGLGSVGWDKAFRAVCTSAGFICMWLALRSGCQLPVLGFIYLVQNLLFWAIAKRQLRKTLPEHIQASATTKPTVLQLFSDGSKLLLLNVLSYSTTQFTIFIVERNFGLGNVASYTAMLRLGMVVASLGGLIPQMLYPYIASLSAASDFVRCRRYYLIGVFGSVGLALFLSLPLYFLGPKIFELWLGPGHFPGNASLAAVLIFYFIYVHHAAHATPALAVCGNAFASAAFINAGLVFMLLLWLPQHWGLQGVPWSITLGTLPSSMYVVWYSWKLMMSKGPRPSFSVALVQKHPDPVSSEV